MLARVGLNYSSLNFAPNVDQKLTYFKHMENLSNLLSFPPALTNRWLTLEVVVKLAYTSGICGMKMI